MGHSFKSIAYKSHSYAGYAKALYYWLTGDIIASGIPDLRAIHPRSIGSTDEIEEVTVYPNPFKDQLSLSISSKEQYNISIVDAFGRIIYSQANEGDITINTSDWNNGLYLVNITRDNEIIHQEKLVLIK